MIKLATTKEELEKIFQLRYEVLRKPWNQPYESSFDELDKISYNAFIEESSVCVACGRLDILNNTTAQIRYMAVKPEYRGKHYGQQILVYLEKLAKDKGIQKILLHARENAVDFYLKNNYKIIQPSHLLFNAIQHYLMEKVL
jgi:N-acetylglutamate synthase-like GNAT family acetyltransferase